MDFWRACYSVAWLFDTATCLGDMIASKGARYSSAISGPCAMYVATPFLPWHPAHWQTSERREHRHPWQLDIRQYKRAGMTCVE